MDMDNTVNPPFSEDAGRLREDPEVIEKLRLKDHDWKKWGPYVTERQWGTVREDYSAKPIDGARRVSRAFATGDSDCAFPLVSGIRRIRSSKKGCSGSPAMRVIMGKT
jgi:hypothetical protein